MKKMFLIGLIVLTSSAFAKDEVIYLDIFDALHSKLASQILNPKVKLEFGADTKASIVEKNIMAVKKQNTFKKSDEQACTSAFLHSIKSLQNKAINNGGTKVINIVGYHKHQKYISDTKFQCGVGNILASVVLKADIAK